MNVVFVNGKVFTADSARSWARAVAVSGGRIVAVGNEAEMTPHLGHSEVIDLAGRLLTPGFTDAHVHPAHGGEKLMGCNLLEANGAEEAVEIVARYARRHPEKEWIKGGGWSQDWFARGCPSASVLDDAVGDRLVTLVNRDGHGAWVSSAALRAARVTASTPDPPDGRIERLEDGSPQGTLHEGAMSLVEPAMPPVTVAELDEALLAGQAHLLSLGITGWFDASVDEALHRAYRRLAERGDLLGSVEGALLWDHRLGMEQIERLEEWRHQPAPGYRPHSVKLVLDGVFENHTAVMLDPYEKVGGHGIAMIDPDLLNEIVPALDAAGFRCHFHAIGDGAVRNALAAVEMARIRNGWTSLRHSICHLQVIHPDDLPRFHRLGVTANIQPVWACEDGYQEELTLPFLGTTRAAWQYQFASLLRAGATLVGGSDWSVSTCDVMEQVEVATTRIPVHDRSLEPLDSAERLDPVTALAAFTAGSAWHNHEEGRRGSIAVGNVSDLAVMDRDPFADGPFAEASVDLVMTGSGWAAGREAS